MKKNFLCLLFLPLFISLKPSTAYGQKNMTLLINVVETLQFLKDIKTNKSILETAAADVKKNYAGNDSMQKMLSQKYSLVKVAADNILNSIIIDLTDKGKRQLFVDRPSLINDYYDDQVSVYNLAVRDFNASYSKLKGEKGLLDIFKQAAKLLLGELLNAAKKVVIEKLIETIRAPYQMKEWKEI